MRYSVGAGIAGETSTTHRQGGDGSILGLVQLRTLGSGMQETRWHRTLWELGNKS